MRNTIQEVRDFWQNAPLFVGESNHEIGSYDFFDEHRNVYLTDVFPCQKTFNRVLIPNEYPDQSLILDLGCGIGFWSVELQKWSNRRYDFYSADLTEKALELTERRLTLSMLKANLSIQNAECLSYPNGLFKHVNCQGVIHHTPNTQLAINEIARVLEKGGTAYISVYYKNFFLRNWGWLSKVVRPFIEKGGLKGRGRELIFFETDIDKITKLFDGDKNPIGKSYTKNEIRSMCTTLFDVEEIFLNFFPARALPIKIPSRMHIFLSSYFGFMIHLNLRKR